MTFNPTLGLILTLLGLYIGGIVGVLSFNPTLGLILTHKESHEHRTHNRTFNPTLGLILTMIPCW